MKKLISLVVASMFATAAFAQNTPGQPPEQTPAGSPGKLTKPTLPHKADVAPTTTTDTAAAPVTKSEKRAARKSKRAAKVGDKPIN